MVLEGVYLGVLRIGGYGCEKNCAFSLLEVRTAAEAQHDFDKRFVNRRLMCAQGQCLFAYVKFEFVFEILLCAGGQQSMPAVSICIASLRSLFA